MQSWVELQEVSFRKNVKEELSISAVNNRIRMGPRRGCENSVSLFRFNLSDF